MSISIQTDHASPLVSSLLLLHLHPHTPARRYAHGLTKLDDIVRAVHGRAIGQHLMPDGRMMALFASEADFAPVHAKLEHKASVHISARNAPKALTLRCRMRRASLS